MGIFDIALKDVTEEKIVEEANKMASDPARKGELMDFFKIFGSKINPKVKAERIKKYLIIILLFKMVICQICQQTIHKMLELLFVK